MIILQKKQTQLKTEFKKLVKNAVRMDAKDKFNKLKELHEKIKHKKNRKQNQTSSIYLNTKSTKKIKSTLFDLRSRIQNEIKENFHHLYSDYTLLNL